MNVTIAELESYLLDHYENGGIDESLFMKLVEEIGEVAEVLNKKAGRKKSGSEDLQAQLGNELADVIHYAIAIAALNDLDMNQIIIEKDKAASRSGAISERTELPPWNTMRKPAFPFAPSFRSPVRYMRPRLKSRMFLFSAKTRCKHSNGALRPYLHKAYGYKFPLST